MTDGAFYLLYNNSFQFNINLILKKMDTFTPKERAIKFSKPEQDRFRSLIEKYKEILFSRRTDNITNIKKNKAWAAIHAEYNAGGDLPRTLRQLKAKFDNMKRPARKVTNRSQTEDLSNVQIKEEKEYIIPNEINENEMNENENQFSFSKSLSSQIVHTDSDPLSINKVCDTKSAASSLRTPISKPLCTHKRPHIIRKDYSDLKTEILTKTKEQEEHIYKLRIKHMEEKRKEEKEIHDLQKKKLILEISLLENKLNN